MSSIAQTVLILPFIRYILPIRVIFGDFWKTLLKMTTYGSEKFTFLFYFFEKNILRPKSAQHGERFRF